MDTNEKKENRQMPAGGGEIVPFAEDSVAKTVFKVPKWNLKQKRKFYIAKCDLRKRSWATHEIPSLCLHRTGSRTTL